MGQSFIIRLCMPVSYLCIAQCSQIIVQLPTDLSAMPSRTKYPVYFITFALLLFLGYCHLGHQFGFHPHTRIPLLKRLPIEVWETRPNSEIKLQRKPASSLINLGSNKATAEVVVDDKKVYQVVDGFGYTLTGGSAMLINKMNATAKNALLRELFGNQEGQIGISFLRLSMGSSDLDDHVFSYNDLPAGQTDIDQSKFSLAPDQVNLVPVLKSILAINPKIKTIATPWSPPTWMKDNGKSMGGTLKLQYYDSYAKYFVKYIKAMQSHGINIYAITPQNEPLHPGNNPSMYFVAQKQRDFIKNSLGPMFQKQKIATKIVVYDHNLDRPDYPTAIYNDAAASKYVDGAAFHMYSGDASVMGALHNSFPNKNLYFTEQWTSSEGSFNGDLEWHIKNIIIGTMRNWSKIALEWNLANDPSFGPHTPGGCTQCKGALTINGSTFTRNVAYYIVAHASQFVPAGSKRIDSNIAGHIQNVAFLRPDGKRAIILFNDGNSAETFNLRFREQFSPVTLEAKTVNTIVF